MSKKHVKSIDERGIRFSSSSGGHDRVGAVTGVFSFWGGWHHGE
jgi:hypothetical protein